MQETHLYEYDSFWSYVQQFDDYHLLLPEIYRWVHADPNVSKQLSPAGHAALSQKYAQWVQAERARIEQMEKTYAQITSSLDSQAAEWIELMDHTSGVGLHLGHFQCRMHAHNATQRNLINNQKKYSVSSDVAAYLQNKGYKSRLYTDNYGNQLQHVLHQECIDMATQTVRLPVQSMLYPCKDAVLDIVDASREFNQLGQSHKTTTLNDFVYALLDCGSAIMEGVAQGIIVAAREIMDHPVQTALCLVAGEYILAYQLAKVTIQLAGIGITYMIDEEAGARSWNDYIQPLRTVIDDLTKQELSVRDRIKGVATFGTALVAQHKMLKGLGSLYNSTQLKAIEFAKKNPLLGPQEYMATPEGLIFKATCDGKDILFKNEIFQDNIPEYFVKKFKKNCKGIVDTLKNFHTECIRLDDKLIILDKKGMKHILKRHHPAYWDGSIKSNQTFFDSTMTINQIKKMIKEVIHNNREKVLTSKSETFQIDAIFNGKKYVVGISKGKVGQFYICD